MSKSWLDTAGDLFEAEGHEPGVIFEFHDQIHPSLHPGGVVVTNLPEGVRPTSYLDIVAVRVKDSTTGRIELLSEGQGFCGAALWITNMHKVTGYL